MLPTAQGKLEASAREELVAQGKELKGQLSQLELRLDDAEAALQHEAQKIPNLTHPQVCLFLPALLAGELLQS